MTETPHALDASTAVRAALALQPEDRPTMAVAQDGDTPSPKYRPVSESICTYMSELGPVSLPRVKWLEGTI